MSNPKLRQLKHLHPDGRSDFIAQTDVADGPEAFTSDIPCRRRAFGSVSRKDRTISRMPPRRSGKITGCSLGQPPPILSACCLRRPGAGCPIRPAPIIER